MNYGLVILILLIIVIYYLIKMFFKIRQNKYDIYILTTIYLIFLFSVLFNRQKLDDSIFSDGTYIKSWIKILFTNRIVFINVIGNILIFVPFGILLCYYNQPFVVSIITIIFSIIIIESLQYFTKRGIFDVLDILLNIVGSVIGYTLYKIYTHKKKR